VGGAAEVLRALPVTAVLDPRQPVPNPYEEEALNVAGERGVRVVAARRGQVLKLGRLVLRVLWPDGSATAADDPNDHAVVLLASYGRIDVLLTADAESQVTSTLGIGPVEVLKVAHHGSDDPGLARLLSRLRPRVAVISVGAHNDFGHPTAATLRALNASPGLELFRTDEHGAVVLESDGSRMSVGTGA
jgi:competence protein ComEC